MLGQIICQEEEREKSSEENKQSLSPFQWPALMEEQWCYDAVMTDPQASCDAATVQVTLN